MSWYDVDTDNTVRLHTQRLSSHTAAMVRCGALRKETTESVLWEVSVDEFLRAPDSVQRLCSLVLSEAVTFVNSKESHLQRLLSEALGVEASEAQVEWAAWYLGLWLVTGQSSLEQISPAALSAVEAQNRPIARRLEECQQLFSAAGKGVTGIVRGLLQSYELLDHPHVPHAWLCDSLEVRRCILAGVLDASRSAQRGDGYHLITQSSVTVDGYKLLASSLGLRNDRVTQQGSGSATSHCLTISGDIGGVIRHCTAVEHQHSSVWKGAVPQSDRPSCGFSLAPQGEDEFFGFSVEGGANLRFLLADFTVTHNVSPLPHSSPLLVPSLPPSRPPHPALSPPLSPLCPSPATLTPLRCTISSSIS